MLVAVMMAFIIFSFTGVAVLNVSYVSSAASSETVDNIKLQYEVESSINEALWRINVGADSLVNVSSDGVTTVWDSTSKTLTVSVDKFHMESEIILDLSEDTHFDRGIAAEDEIVLNGHDAGLNEAQQVRSNFDFLPEADLQYFLNNANYIHWSSFREWENETLPDGIHIFFGNHLVLENITLNSGTLLFTGYDIDFRRGNEIFAPTSDSTGAHPAVIFTNPWQDFNAYSPENNETIIGAVYCKGNVVLRNGHFSGPIVGKRVYLNENFDFLDDENQDRFQWTHGFGAKSQYDWPKQIGRWRIHKWVKKNIVIPST